MIWQQSMYNPDAQLPQFLDVMACKGQKSTSFSLEKDVPNQIKNFHIIYLRRCPGYAAVEFN